jgi:hypothetical protein
MAKKCKITEGQLREAIKDALMEGPFGISNDFLNKIGIKNPGDRYEVNYQEIIQKCNEFQTYLNAFKEYFDGKEDEVEEIEGENGEEPARKYGVTFNAQMKNAWWDPKDWNKADFQLLTDSLEELSELLRNVSLKIEEVKDCAEYFIPRR